MFYPLQLDSNEEAAKNAVINPGTLKVLDVDGREIWTRPEGLEHRVVPYSAIEAYVEAERAEINALMLSPDTDEELAMRCLGRQHQLSSLLSMAIGLTTWRD